MRARILAAGIAVAALIPTFALAQQTCEQARQNRVAGTVVGAGLGALLGSAIAGRHDATSGAIVGGVGGAIVGNQLAKSNQDCVHAYGYYDRDGAWHANNIVVRDAAGYYDRDGRWVDGRPDGYHRADGVWINASDDHNYRGSYDTDGRWIPGSPRGYYDINGRWVDRAAVDARSRGSDTSYSGRMDAWNGASSDIDGRAAWLQRRINARYAAGNLSRDHADRAMHDLDEIRRLASERRDRNGYIKRRDLVDLKKIGLI